MRWTLMIGLLLAVALVAPGSATAQINFEKTGYYLSLGDSVAAGEGALPVTHGFVYDLYDRGVFGRIQTMDFGNIAIKGATAKEVLLLQVPQALCIQPPRIAVGPSVITITAGANDFLAYLAGPKTDPLHEIPVVADGIAADVEKIIRSLVFGAPAVCAGDGIPGITVLVSNYYRFNHPVPEVEFLLNLALTSFDTSLRLRVAQIEAEIQATGRTAKVGYVDTLSAMDRHGSLLLIEKRNGYDGPFEFEIHPTNAGHRVIADQFEKVWKSLQ